MISSPVVLLLAVLAAPPGANNLTVRLFCEQDGGRAPIVGATLSVSQTNEKNAKTREVGETDAHGRADVDLTGLSTDSFYLQVVAPKGAKFKSMSFHITRKQMVWRQTLVDDLVVGEEFVRARQSPETTRTVYTPYSSFRPDGLSCDPCERVYEPSYYALPTTYYCVPAYSSPSLLWWLRF